MSADNEESLLGDELGDSQRGSQVTTTLASHDAPTDADTNASAAHDTRDCGSSSAKTRDSSEAADRDSAAADNVNEETSDSDSSGDHSDEEDVELDDEELDYHFATDEEAEAARQVGLQAYNEGRYNDALDQQYRVVRYFSSTYGVTSSRCGTYFLDYGLSQLRVLQSQQSLEDALQPRDQEALETCYINLEVARVCFQKQEMERGEEDVETQLSLGEVHNALAQLNAEKEDYDAALREYEAELLIYRTLQESVQQRRRTADGNADAQPTAAPQSSENGADTANPTHVTDGAHQTAAVKEENGVPVRRIIATLYGIADCYMKEADFDAAAERLQLTLDEIAKYPDNTVEPELVDELRDLLTDANEMKGGKYKELQEVIRQQFTAEAEQMPTAQEFYAVGNDEKHPYLSSLPGCADAGGEASHLSMPMSASGHVLGLNEHSCNSQSISFFPHRA